VEIEGQKKLEASCATLATEGLEVRTDTPRVRKIRQTVLEMMLVHHPLDCPVCDKAGECDLQDLVYQYGKPGGRFTREKKLGLPETKGPLVEFNPARCILCGKCVRLCGEHQGRSAGTDGKGFSTTVQPAFGETLEWTTAASALMPALQTPMRISPSNSGPGRGFSREGYDMPLLQLRCTLTLGIRKAGY
jgi:NADH dehydrogenase/NADH:ubiquinone oxidoreductase subunit G